VPESKLRELAAIEKHETKPDETKAMENTKKIPWRPPHSDAWLDLQQLLHRVYDAAGYEDYIYRSPPQPRLDSEDTAWAQQLVPVS